MPTGRSRRRTQQKQPPTATAKARPWASASNRAVISARVGASGTALAQHGMILYCSPAFFRTPRLRCGTPSLADSSCFTAVGLGSRLFGLLALLLAIPTSAAALDDVRNLTQWHHWHHASTDVQGSRAPCGQVSSTTTLRKVSRIAQLGV